MVLAESAVVVGIALVVGGLLCLPPLVGVGLGLSEGRSAVPHVDLVTSGATAAGVVLLGVLSMVLAVGSQRRGAVQ